MEACTAAQQQQQEQVDNSSSGWGVGSRGSSGASARCWVLEYRACPAETAHHRLHPSPFGLTKWMMLLSSLMMFTSSMPGMVFTPSLLSVFCKRLSSVEVVLCTAFFFLRGEEPIRRRASGCLEHDHLGPGGADRWCTAPGAGTNLRTVPLPPVLTADAIFMSLSRSIFDGCLLLLPLLGAQWLDEPPLLLIPLRLIPAAAASALLLFPLLKDLGTPV